MPFSPVNSPAPARPGVESPIRDFEPFEDEAEILGNLTADESDGEELFGDNMER